jgi:hypothetical protein
MSLVAWEGGNQRRPKLMDYRKPIRYAVCYCCFQLLVILAAYLYFS